MHPHNPWGHRVSTTVFPAHIHAGKRTPTTVPWGHTSACPGTLFHHQTAAPCAPPSTAGPGTARCPDCRPALRPADLRACRLQPAGVGGSGASVPGSMGPHARLRPSHTGLSQVARVAAVAVALCGDTVCWAPAGQGEPVAAFPCRLGAGGTSPPPPTGRRVGLRFGDRADHGLAHRCFSLSPSTPIPPSLK